MTEHVLTYFDFDGGRGEPVRLAFHIGSIPFEDRRWAFPEFGQRRGELRFEAVPTLLVDGEQLSQSNSMLRYVGKLAGLYPSDPLEAYHCDEVMDAVEDIAQLVVATFGLQGEELKQAREKLVEGKIPVFVKGISKLLERGGGTYFAGGKLSVADLKVFTWLRSITSGRLDHIPADLPARLAPNLLAHNERVAAHEGVAAYYAARS